MADGKVFFIYCHTAPNGKRYVGQTCQKLGARWKRGRGYRSNTYFAKAISKYGWESFNHDILCVVHSKRLADLFEKHYIEQYDTFNQDHGYNLTKGGGGTSGRVLSKAEVERLVSFNKGRAKTDDERRKISTTLKAGYRDGTIVAVPTSEEARKRMSVERTGSGNPMYGKHHSQEARESMSRKRRGMKRSVETKKRISESRYKSKRICRRQVDQFDLDGNFIATYPSIKLAAKAVGDHESSIGSCCKGKMRRSKQFRWRYHEDTEFAYEALRRSRMAS